MSRVKILDDFQIFARATGLQSSEQRAINENLFATYEPIRLLLKQRRIQAPFRKLVVTFADQRVSMPWHGHVALAAGLCDVTEAVDLEILRLRSDASEWVLQYVKHALGRINDEIGWSSAAIKEDVERLNRGTFPFIHFFDDLSLLDKTTGVRCDVWLSVRPGLTEIGTTFAAPNGTNRRVIVRSKSGPIFIEDEFPMAKTAAKDGRFLFLDKKDNLLVDLPMGD